MNTLRTLITMGATCAALGLAALGFAGCGEDTGDATASENSPVTATAAGEGLAIDGDDPVDVEIAIDRTAILKGNKALATQYKAAALDAAEFAITRGGSLNVTLFGRVGAEALTVYQPPQPIPSLKELGRVARQDQARRQEIGLALDVALGLTPATGVAKDELDRLTERSGSDVTRMTGDAIANVLAGDADHKVVLGLSDGFHNEPDLDLYHLVSKPLSDDDIQNIAKRMADIAGGPSDAADVHLRILGIGQTSGALSLDALALERLEHIWTLTCQNLATTCQIQTTL